MKKAAKADAQFGHGGKRTKLSKPDDAEEDMDMMDDYDEDDALMAEMDLDDQGNGEAMEEDPVGSMEDGRAQWKRPDVGDLRPNQDNLVFQQIEIDHYIGEFLKFMMVIPLYVE